MDKSIAANILIEILDEVLDQIELVRPDLIYRRGHNSYELCPVLYNIEHKSYGKILIHPFSSRAEIWILKWDDRHSYDIIQLSNPNIYEAILDYVNTKLPND